MRSPAKVCGSDPGYSARWSKSDRLRVQLAPGYRVGYAAYANPGGNWDSVFEWKNFRPDSVKGAEDGQGE
ncbi:MAG: hypothetical protein VB144_07935 [Clostridia bacterium]|nr:hypothetical protein [Clostridia bacterium]